MALSWSGRRQLLYYAVGFLLLALLLWSAYDSFFNRPPTCFDQAQNGNETGVDCGGSCALLCRNESKAPVVLWSRAFSVGTSTYTAAAYVQNNNPGSGAHSVRYSFQLFDANNSLVVERDGVMNIPSVVLVPVIETGIEAGERTVARTLFSFDSLPVWVKSATKPPMLSLANQVLASDGSALAATLVNDGLIDLKGVVVEAVLFDSSGVARGASKSVLDSPRQSSSRVVFTWPASVPGVIRAEITVLPPF